MSVESKVGEKCAKMLALITDPHIERKTPFNLTKALWGWKIAGSCINSDKVSLPGITEKNLPHYIKFSNFPLEEDEKSVKYQEGNTDWSNTRLSELD